jgi:hypothetical protein
MGLAGKSRTVTIWRITMFAEVNPNITFGSVTAAVESCGFTLVAFAAGNGANVFVKDGVYYTVHNYRQNNGSFTRLEMRRLAKGRKVNMAESFGAEGVVLQ